MKISSCRSKLLLVDRFITSSQLYCTNATLSLQYATHIRLPIDKCALQEYWEAISRQEGAASKVHDQLRAEEFCQIVNQTSRESGGWRAHDVIDNWRNALGHYEHANGAGMQPVSHDHRADRAISEQFFATI